MRFSGHRASATFCRYAIKDERVLPEAAEKLNRAGLGLGQAHLGQNEVPADGSRRPRDTATH